MYTYTQSRCLDYDVGFIKIRTQAQSCFLYTQNLVTSKFVYHLGVYIVL